MEQARNRVFPILLGIVALLAVSFGLWWWLEGRHWESTDNAYVEADMAVIAAKVPGYVATVDVKDNQPVKASDPLVHIVDADYRAAFAKAEADVERLTRERGAAGARVVAEADAIAQAQAALRAAEAQSVRAAADAKRAENLLAQGFATRATVDQRRAEAASASALVAERRAGIAAATASRQAASGSAGGAGAAQKAALAQREAARLDLENTVIRAPFDGVVGNRSVRPGQFARQGQQMLVVVPVDEAYLVANFKETQIAGMKPGMPAEVTLDAFPDSPLKARIDSFSPASGSRFSIIPPENATGNFTRIVQRVPVKIVLDQPLPEGMRMVPGISAKVSVDLRRQPGE
ncbi:HlyD family secretion protein [Sandaracinobacter sp. RS1-74]|uniref:HlyD family secretion protein n=1 Tax=Sandaracinobacteroides sayramensis TaxID=2913411 RepID=UPI001EDBB12E|nr:HlyD family secretion protein [Sandaracinobacteroides sayramensis]MCG2841577.1 HlyD family secretion protein [Sandaracinobacteroides sayramensis]